MLSCCQRRGLEYCFECAEFPCPKYEGVDESDSFITHKNQFIDMEKAKRIGMDAYRAELDEKIKLLEGLLENYDDGRRKSFFCAAVNLLELPDIKTVIAELEAQTKPGDPVKEKAKLAARLFQELADERGISLKLRK